MPLAFQFFPVQHPGEQAASDERPLRSGFMGHERSIGMTDRRQIEPAESYRERLANFAIEARERALALAPGADRDELLKKARQADTASKLDEWANSPGLQRPK